MTAYNLNVGHRSVCAPRAALTSSAAMEAAKMAENYGSTVRLKRRPRWKRVLVAPSFFLKMLKLWQNYRAAALFTWHMVTSK